MFIANLDSGGLLYLLTKIWNNGVIIDQYKESCTYLGEDAFGNARFHSVYTPIK